MIAKAGQRPGVTLHTHSNIQPNRIGFPHIGLKGDVETLYFKSFFYTHTHIAKTKTSQARTQQLTEACLVLQSEYQGRYCTSTMLMNYAHCINSLCGAHEVMDTLIYNSCMVVITRLNHTYADEDLYHTATATVTWYVCARYLLSLAVSPDIETPHPQLSPKQQTMNQLINFTGLLALWFKSKAQKTEVGSLKQCNLYHKLGSAIYLCSATAAILLLTMIWCNLLKFYIW